MQASIAEAQAERSKRTEITQDRVLQELAAIGFSDVRKVFQGGHLLDSKDWPDEVAPAVAGVDVVTRGIGEGEVEYVAKLKLWDKGRALEAIARHLGMMRQDVNPTTTDMETWQAQAQRQQRAAKSPSPT